MNDRESIYIRASNRALARYEEVIREQTEIIKDLESRLAGCDEDYYNKIQALQEPVKVYIDRCKKCKGTGNHLVVEPDGNLWTDCERCRWARDLLK
jgi:hypothetical protein